MALAVGVALSGVISAGLDPLSRAIARVNNVTLQVEPLTVSDALQAWLRGKITRGELDNVLAQSGYNEQNRNVIRDIVRELLTSQQAIEAWHRDLIDRQELNEILQARGYHSKDIDVLVSLSRELLGIADIIQLKRFGELEGENYESLLQARGIEVEKIPLWEHALRDRPPLSDIIRFAVREAFREDIVAQLKLDEDLPTRVLEEGRKRGLTDEETKWYWRAHWELPSVEQGIEMVHRNVMTEEEFDALLKMHDVSPVYREKFKKIIFALPTRVDVRRMFRIGVVDEEYVYQTYRKLGYDDDTARALTQFTKLSETEEEKALTKAEVLNAFEEGELDEQKAQDALLAIGYSHYAAQIILNTKKIELRKKAVKSEVEEVKARVEAGEISLEQAHDMLAGLGLSSARTEAELKKIERGLRKNVTRLTKDEYVKAWNEKVIDELQLRNYLTNLGYDEEHINIIFKVNKIEVST